MSGADASRDPAGRGNQIRQILSVVLALNLIVAGAKLGYGFVSGSVAMSADGFNSLLDGFANVLGIVGIAVAARPPDRAIGRRSLADGGDAAGYATLVWSDARHHGDQHRSDHLGTPGGAQTP
jgi:hypothetical protein